jgi:hypothetical protein
VFSSSSSPVFLVEGAARVVAAAHGHVHVHDRERDRDRRRQRWPTSGEEVELAVVDVDDASC